MGTGLLLLALLSAGPDAASRAVAEVRPAVVSIDVDKLTRRRQSESGRSDLVQVRSLGAGFVFDERGHVLTCNHVVAGYDEIRVRFPDGTDFAGPDVKVVGRDPATDIAVLKVDAGQLVPVARLGDSDSLEIGQWVAAVGNPYGLVGSATIGIVSGLSRWGLSKSSGPDFQEFIQTDALINPGSSGGPLVDMSGRVVGVASFRRNSGQREPTGIGFATPINLARQVAEQLITHGVVIRGYLGLNTQPVTDEIMLALALDSDEGALVSVVIPGSPADLAGIRAGDLILELDGEAVPDVRWLQNELVARQPGDTVTLSLLRRGQSGEVSAVLEAWPVAGTEPRQAPPAEHWLGLLVRDMDEADRLRTRAEQGVAVQAIEPSGAAEDAGLLPGDVIIEINFSPIDNFGTYRTIAGKMAGYDRPVLLRVLRGSNVFYVAVGP